MSKRAKKARPVRAERRLRDRKDFLRTKYAGHSFTPAEYRAKQRRSYSTKGLRQPRKEWGRYFWYSPQSPKFTGERGWRCDTRGCQNHGYGPMLRTIVWKQHFRGVSFACEPCMVRRLGRPLNRNDLRNCPMNLIHPAFDLDLKLSS